MILLIDNYDSFVHNPARYVRELGDDAVVRRQRQGDTGGIEALAPSDIILSPGACSPTEAGISTSVVRRFGPTIPILGVCLGHPIGRGTPDALTRQLADTYTALIARECGT